MKNHATSEGTKRYAARYPDAARGHFREAHGLALSSIGIGTYLGSPDAATDERYAEAVAAFVEGGGNVIDTAANYRFQRSERAIGAALKILGEKGFAREEIFVSTKGGYLPFDGAPPRDVRAYFEENFVAPGIATFDDLVAGSHCMTPRYLASQIAQSLANLDLATIDLYYLHNPESQLQEVDRYTFEARLARAFEQLERERADGRLRFYGAATWNGFRAAPDDASYHSLEAMLRAARAVGGDAHGFRFIQLPLNLAMPEAYLLKNQAASGKVYSVLEAAAALGVAVMTSASILQGRLAHSIPLHLRELLGNPLTDAAAAIQFARSTPGVATALVGMSRAAHVEENLSLARLAPVDEGTYRQLFA